MRKNVLVPLLFILILLAVGILYWYYLAPPATFPDQEKLEAILSNPYNRVEVAEIQDMIFLDDKHVYIPFITQDEGHGISLWEWKKHEWQLSGFSIGNMPKVWKIDSEDPSSHYIMWNFHPENNLDYLTFFLIKERGFSVTEGKQHYEPGIQMDYRAEAREKSYGYTSIPSDWQKYIEVDNKLLAAMNDSLFADFFPPAQYYFGWQSTSIDGTIEYPSYPDNNGFGSGGQSTDTIRFLNENEIYLNETGSSE
ncbi:hypothetical protein M3172_18280 [Mesobacillus subterraneus]|uniref:hypothetical protein n=1 Tax=Mesobacillus subterraneus TaxID=285983 RepID=UPI00203ADEC4|nr:hypothetical protein [Mesobacillus subterraneus]MCM3575148.1 hypothetical protein [Mesobacillus subterraneus]